MKTPRFKLFFLSVLVLIVTLSCSVTIGQPPEAETPTLVTVSPTLVSESSTQAVTPSPSELLPTPQEVLSSPTPSQEQAPLFTTENCDEDVCILDGSFFLKRPIGSDGRNAIDTASRYGTLRRRIRDVYHGVQFLNSTGTPVYAAEAGDVEVAGDDSQIFYGPRLGMFGNLVIIKHSLPGIPEPVYTLYAHLSELSTKAEGDVGAGEQIGLVGMSGSVRGSTLYFEVRYGDNDYDAAVNPELWLEPLRDQTGDLMGALAGKVIDDQGNYVAIRNIQIESLRTAAEGKLRPIYIRTYLDPAQMGLSPWGESFAAGDLPEGTYLIWFWYGPNEYIREVEIEPGKLTYVTFVVK